MPPCFDFKNLAFYFTSDSQVIWIYGSTAVHFCSQPTCLLIVWYFNILSIFTYDIDMLRAHRTPFFEGQPSKTRPNLQPKQGSFGFQVVYTQFWFAKSTYALHCGYRCCCATLFLAQPRQVWNRACATDHGGRFKSLGVLMAWNEHWKKILVWYPKQPFLLMDVWWFPPIFHVMIWNHPLGLKSNPGTSTTSSLEATLESL